MTLLNHFDLLSDVPERRSVELDFLRRLRDNLGVQSAHVIEVADKRPLEVFPAQYDLMHGPLFDELAKVMTGDVPEDEDFGPFRGGA